MSILEGQYLARRISIGTALLAATSGLAARGRLKGPVGRDYAASLCTGAQTALRAGA